MAALRREVAGMLRPGEELVVIGAAALSGTAEIARKKYRELSAFFSAGFLQDACRLEQTYGVGEEPRKSEAWKIALTEGAGAVYAMGEGGVLSALWKTAEASQVGLTADLRKIPIRQETIEICERYDLNPYKLKSGGALLVGISGGEALVRQMKQMGLPAAVIGETNEGNDRLLYSREKCRYLERPGEDELRKLLL